MDDLSKNKKKKEAPVEQSSEDEEEGSAITYGKPVDAKVV
jgi:hypothetical protein